MAANPFITGSGAQDTRQRPVTGRQVAGQGNVAARGVGYHSGDAQGEYASTHTMTADKTGTVGAGASVFTAGAVWLDSILVTTAGTVEAVIFDNAGPQGTATGTIIGIIPANTARGTIIKCQMPVALGISAVGAASTPAYTFSYA